MAAIVDELNRKVLDTKMTMNNELTGVKNNLGGVRATISKKLLEVKDGSKGSNALMHANIEIQKVASHID